MRRVDGLPRDIVYDVSGVGMGLGGWFRIKVGTETLFVLSAPSPTPPRVLSAAEAEVIAAVLAGRKNAEIAAARRTSKRTVANQLASAYRKLGVRSRFELIAKLAADCK